MNKYRGWQNSTSEFGLTESWVMAATMSYLQFMLNQCQPDISRVLFQSLMRRLKFDEIIMVHSYIANWKAAELEQERHNREEQLRALLQTIQQSYKISPTILLSDMERITTVLQSEDIPLPLQVDQLSAGLQDVEVAVNHLLRATTDGIVVRV